MSNSETVKSWKELNRQAMTIPADRLADALSERISAKAQTLAGRDSRFGKDRVWIGSYMENIGFPPLFGYDMNRFYRDTAFMVEMELRQRIFWLDNSDADDQGGFGITPNTGMYWDFSLFGQQISISAEGVPTFLPHPIAQAADPSIFRPFDFNETGDMPSLMRQHRQLQEISRERYGNKLIVGFPQFHRGPMDLFIQMRGYEKFIEDTMDNPGFAHAMLEYMVSERFRWRKERAAFLGQTFKPEPTFLAADWINPPFISPLIFAEFALPAFLKIQENEGPVNDFHTCGPLLPFVDSLLKAMPAIRCLDVSGWNDFEKLDDAVEPGIKFSLKFKNTFILAGSEEEHRSTLMKIRRIAARREVIVFAPAIVKLHDTYEEDLGRMNRFINLTREMLSA